MSNYEPITKSGVRPYALFNITRECYAWHIGYSKCDTHIVMYKDRPMVRFSFVVVFIPSLCRFGGGQAVTTGATNVTIVSADKDLAQLVTRRVNMLDVYTGERMGPDEV